MKKALPILLVAAAIAVAGVIYLVKRDKVNLANPTGRAVDLAPADTVVFLEIPDVSRTQTRWKETALYKISQEQEWKDFTAKSGQMIQEDAVFRDATGLIAEVQKADPAGLFVALTSFEGAAPKFVAGVPCRAPKSDVESVITQLRDKIVKSWPAAKTEITMYEGIEVRTITDPKFTGSMAYHENWFFFATDTDLLLKTLGRFLKKPDAAPALAKDPLWTDSAHHGSAEPDLRLWARWSAFADKLKALGAMAGPGGAVAIDDPNPAQAVTYTWKLDGPLMRDRIYVHLKDPAPMQPLSNKLVAFSNPATYAYLATSLSATEASLKSSLQALSSFGVTDTINQVLAPKGLKLDDVFTTFGPEIAVMSAWEAGGMTLPDVFAAAEIKDPAKARLFAELFADQMKSNGEVTTSTEAETTIWTSAAPLPLFKPTVAVNANHLMVAMNPVALNSAMQQVAGGKPNVATHPGSPFPAAVKTVVPPAGMLLYIDAKTLFDRVYDKLKPMIAFSLLGNPEAGKYFDSSKLPQAKTISQHLAPMILSHGSAEKGWVIEGTGSVSLMGTYTLAATTLFGLRSRAVVPNANLEDALKPAPAPATPPTPSTPPSSGTPEKPQTPIFR